MVSKHNADESTSENHSDLRNINLSRETKQNKKKKKRSYQEQNLQSQQQQRQLIR